MYSVECITFLQITIRMKLYLDMFVWNDSKRDRYFYENTQKPQEVAAFKDSSEFVTRASKGAQRTDSTCSIIQNPNMTHRLFAVNSNYSRFLSYGKD